MSERIWHKGPPPHVGWWNASMSYWNDCWRWWDGEFWSTATTSDKLAPNLVMRAYRHHEIEWTDYYPENARVPRIDPRSTK